MTDPCRQCPCDQTSREVAARLRIPEGYKARAAESLRGTVELGEVVECIIALHEYKAIGCVMQDAEIEGICLRHYRAGRT